MDTIYHLPEAADPESQRNAIKDIIDAGKWVKFTYKSGAIKIVKEWNPDEVGDLHAHYSTGVSEYVCPTAAFGYTFEAIEPES